MLTSCCDITDRGTALPAQRAPVGERPVRHPAVHARPVQVVALDLMISSPVEYSDETVQFDMKGVPLLGCKSCQAPVLHITQDVSGSEWRIESGWLSQAVLCYDILRRTQSDRMEDETQGGCALRCLVETTQALR